jgi:hypothetical protein
VNIAMPEQNASVPSTIGFLQIEYGFSVSSFWVAMTGTGVPCARWNCTQTVHSPRSNPAPLATKLHTVKTVFKLKRQKSLPPRESQKRKAGMPNRKIRLSKANEISRAPEECSFWDIRVMYCGRFMHFGFSRRLATNAFG